MGGPKGKGKGKGMQVKNKEASQQQITAEQIIREAAGREVDARARAPVQRISDEAELQDYRVRKRKEFEDLLRAQQHNMGIWIKYATWECAQQNFRQGRSIFERALNVDFQNVSLWLKYLDMEMKNKFVNHARNLFNRVCQLLPRVDQFWFKFAHMEELLGNYAGARTVYDRWMEWEPLDQAWLQYIKFEERCGETERARAVMERYVNCRPSVESFLRLCKFEEKAMNSVRARAGYERGVEVLGDDHLTEKFYIRFAEFEEKVKEVDRARAIYKLALDRLPKSESKELYQRYVSFEKQRGDRDDVDDVVLNRRRFKYEEALKENPRNYDTWFDYVRLEESTQNVERIREIYERAVANIPPIQQKPFWRRYVYFWINYAMFEELQAGDAEKARQVHKAVVNLIPHKMFSFAKIWINYAEFEIRQENLDGARKIYGMAIAMCGKVKIFEEYAQLEMRLGNIDRCRKIYEKFVETHPMSPKSWLAFIDVEESIGEEERCRAICELAISQEVIDQPELLWKRYIDFEASMEEWSNARRIFERLIEKTQNVKVWNAYAQFECENMPDEQLFRDILERGIKHMKANSLVDERVFLLERLLKLEKKYGDAEGVKKAESRQPRKTTKRRMVMDGQGGDDGFENVVDYTFPDDQAAKPNMKILEMAKLWKEKGGKGAA